MDVKNHLAKARSASAAKRQAVAAAQPFLIAWRAGGTEQVTGYSALADRLRLKVQSIRCKLATGRGAFDCVLPSPLTGEPDVATITRLPLPQAAQSAAKRGRPRKRDA